MPRAALYTRVSTEDQAAEGFSLEAQREKLRAYCDARGWRVVGPYVDDGYSGRDDRRPAYQRMLEERDRWDTILVMKMDRIHRNSRNFMAMMDRLRSWGKEFTSMQESLDTGTAMGRFVMDIIQRIAQLESEQTAERVYMGMQQKAKSSGAPLGFPAPFGYRWAHGTLRADRQESKAVQEVFRLHREGAPLRVISERLNALRIRTRRGGPWTLWAVRYLLQNPVYAGYLLWDGILQPGRHEALIPRAEFIEMLSLFHDRARTADGRRRLRGLMSAIEAADEEEHAKGGVAAEV